MKLFTNTITHKQNQEEKIIKNILDKPNQEDKTIKNILEAAKSRFFLKREHLTFTDAFQATH